MTDPTGERVPVVDPVAHDIDGPEGTLRVTEWTADTPDTATLFVHGATYPGRAIFGPGLDGVPGWGPWTAAHGDTALALDVRGYGGSHDVWAGEDTPVRTPAATADLAAAVEWAGDRFDRLHLVGTSWGTMTCGRYLATHEAAPVASVTLHAPVYDLSPAVRERLAVDGPFRTVTRDGARDRWAAQVPDGADTDRWLAGFDAFWRTYAGNSRFVVDGRTDPETATVRAPNGCLADILASADGDPAYDPAAVTTPTLVVRGTADHTSVRSDAVGVYDRLGGSPGRHAYAEVEGGTHFVHLEPPRTRLFEPVRAFQCGA
jgi:pimeloyl-ACP methyl ester carboxylesterase